MLGAAALAAVLVVGTGLFLLLRGPGGPPAKTTTVYADDFSTTSSGWNVEALFDNFDLSSIG